MAPKATRRSPRKWLAYYRATSRRPPRELLLRTLDHLEWEGGSRKRRRRAIDIGFGAGNDTLELLRRGWEVLAVDGEPHAAEFLARRVPPRLRRQLTTLVAPMEGISLPPADLVYASFSLPFCAPERFPELWRTIRRSVRPGGHFAGVFFGDRDQWQGKNPFSFFDESHVRRLSRGYRIEMLRETEEDGMAFDGPKHWHFFDVIFERRR